MSHEEEMDKIAEEIEEILKKLASDEDNQGLLDELKELHLRYVKLKNPNTTAFLQERERELARRDGTDSPPPANEESQFEMEPEPEPDMEPEPQAMVETQMDDDSSNESIHVHYQVIPCNVSEEEEALILTEVFYQMGDITEIVRGSYPHVQRTDEQIYADFCLSGSYYEHIMFLHDNWGVKRVNLGDDLRAAFAEQINHPAFEGFEDCVGFFGDSYQIFMNANLDGGAISPPLNKANLFAEAAKDSERITAESVNLLRMKERVQEMATVAASTLSDSLSSLDPSAMAVEREKIKIAEERFKMMKKDRDEKLKIGNLSNLAREIQMKIWLDIIGGGDGAETRTEADNWKLLEESSERILEKERYLDFGMHEDFRSIKDFLIRYVLDPQILSASALQISAPLPPNISMVVDRSNNEAVAVPKMRSLEGGEQSQGDEHRSRAAPNVFICLDYRKVAEKIKRKRGMLEFTKGYFLRSMGRPSLTLDASAGLQEFFNRGDSNLTREIGGFLKGGKRKTRKKKTKRKGKKSSKKKKRSSKNKSKKKSKKKKRSSKKKSKKKISKRK